MKGLRHLEEPFVLRTCTECSSGSAGDALSLASGQAETQHCPDKQLVYNICPDLSRFPPPPDLFCLTSSPEGSAREMDSTLPAVAEELLKEIRKAFQETSHVPDDLLLGLKFIFGPSAVPALDLVDQRSVTRVVSPSGRTAYQVLGSSGKLYTCYSSCHFCTCPAFGFTVLQKSESLLCKHILAVYLSQAMGACQELTVSEEQLTSILLAEEEDEG